MAATQAASTAEQLLHSPGLGRWELIRGELRMMSPAGFEHGYLVVQVTLPLADFVKQHGLGIVIGAETGFHIGHDPDTVLAPDVGFVGAERVPPALTKGFFQGPPDLAVEVISPEDRASEVLAKTRAWLAAGCRMVWVVDPETRTVSVHRSSKDVAVLEESDQLTGEDVVPGFSLPVIEIFGGAR